LLLGGATDKSAPCAIQYPAVAAPTSRALKGSERMQAVSKEIGDDGAVDGRHPRRSQGQLQTCGGLASVYGRMGATVTGGPVSSVFCRSRHDRHLPLELYLLNCKLLGIIAEAESYVVASQEAGMQRVKRRRGRPPGSTVVPPDLLAQIWVAGLDAPDQRANSDRENSLGQGGLPCRGSSRRCYFRLGRACIRVINAIPYYQAAKQQGMVLPDGIHLNARRDSTIWPPGCYH
jgi:hypothetical protein